MSACQLCCPWNFPFTRKEQHIVGAGPVAMRYEEWIVYHLHIVLHQEGKYAGELTETIHEAPQLKEVITHA